MRTLLELSSLSPIRKAVWAFLTLLLFNLIWLPPFDFLAFAKHFFDPAEDRSLTAGISVVVPIALALLSLAACLGWILQAFSTIIYRRYVYSRLVQRYGHDITLSYLLSPRHLWLIRPLRYLSYAFTLGLVLFLCLCGWFRISSLEDVDAYRGMAAECHPVWRAFACRQFSQGDSAKELSQAYPPTDRVAFGRYTILRYDKEHRVNGGAFTSFSVIARDDQLISAGAVSCTWHLIFFDKEDPQLDREYQSYREAKLKEHEDF